MNTIRERIRRAWEKEILWECPMADYTTLRVGGPADALIRPGSREELIRLVGCLTEAQVPWRVIGRGSNILVADQGVEGVVIVLGRDFAAVSRADGASLLVEAGCSLARLSSWCLEQGLSGLEFVTGIPGTVGGAIMMNAGAFGGEVSQVISEVELMDDRGRIERRPLSPADFRYRGWRQPHAKVVVTGRFRVEQGLRADISERCRHYVKERAGRQPKGVASAGSFFRNPPGGSAGRLIDQAGLKGLRVGGAEVSRVHANFLVNSGKARAADFLELMRAVQRGVAARFGVDLEPEVEFVGRW